MKSIKANKLAKKELKENYISLVTGAGYVSPRVPPKEKDKK